MRAGPTRSTLRAVQQMALALPEGQSGSYAVVEALSLYLSFINLFLILLRFSGGRRS